MKVCLSPNFMFFLVHHISLWEFYVIIVYCTACVMCFLMLNEYLFIYLLIKKHCAPLLVLHTVVSTESRQKYFNFFLVLWLVPNCMTLTEFSYHSLDFTQWLLELKEILKIFLSMIVQLKNLQSRCKSF